MPYPPGGLSTSPHFFALAFSFLGNYIQVVRHRPGTSQTPRVSDLSEHLGFWLRFVSNQVSGQFARSVEENGVSVSEWVALRALYAADVVATAALIASLGMTKGAVSKVIDRLVDKDLAVRLAEPDDGRAQRLALTAAGRALVPKLAALADANDERFFHSLPEKDRAALRRILRHLVDVHGLKQVPTE